MVLPNTLIIGAQKAGSSWLATNLSQHPEVFMPEQEVHFFNLERRYLKGLKWYQEQFKQAKNKKIVAEKTPNYLWITQEKVKTRFGNHLAAIHQRIHAALPDAKLIVVLRNPVERAISAVNHYRTHGQISPLLKIDSILAGEVPEIASRFGVLEMGKYHAHLSAYYECYRPDQILVINFEEDIAKNPELGLKKACNFLEISSPFNFQDRQKQCNSFRPIRYGSALAHHLFPKRILLRKLVSALPKPLLGSMVAKSRPSDDTIAKLYDFYKEDNENLFKLLKHRFDSWENL